jgi:Domain of unknown function (DUF4258)
MNKELRNISIVAILFLVLAYVFYNYKLTPRSNATVPSNTNNTTTENNTPQPNNNKHANHHPATGPGGSSHANDASEINRHPNHIIYTKHAKCRMGCRHFDDSEVQEILADGEVNLNKSNDRPGDCPTYALEGTTHDGQHARMVFAFCKDGDAKVITVIDLGTDYKCDCY